MALNSISNNSHKPILMANIPVQDKSTSSSLKNIPKSDEVDLSAKKQSLSTIQKVGIGVSIATVIGGSIVFIASRGRNIKATTEIIEEKGETLSANIENIAKKVENTVSNPNQFTTESDTLKNSVVNITQNLKAGNNWEPSEEMLKKIMDEYNNYPNKDKIDLKNLNSPEGNSFLREAFFQIGDIKGSIFDDESVKVGHILTN